MSAKDERPEHRVRADRVSRSLRPLRMGAATAASRAATKLRSIGATSDEKEARLLEFHERVAERYVKELGEMKGAIMKIGQLLAVVDVGMIPERYRELYRRSFGSLLAGAPPMPTEVLEETLELELGAPTQDVFAEFSPEPLAAASIGQVHAARLQDGTEVAVKVQYPGVAEAIGADLEHRAALHVHQDRKGIDGRAVAATDPRLVADEISERIGEELDYGIEPAQPDGVRSSTTAAIRSSACPRSFPDCRPSGCSRWRWSTGGGGPRRCGDQELRDRWGEVIDRFFFG